MYYKKSIKTIKISLIKRIELFTSIFTIYEIWNDDTEKR